MTYNRRTPLHVETGKQGVRSLSFEASSPYARTSSHREWRNSPLAPQPFQYRSDAQCSPSLQQYMPPPPIVGRSTRASACDYDTAAAQGCSPGLNLNNAIPSSPSPLAEARYAGLGETCRPSSAIESRPARGFTSPTAHTPIQRAASTVMAPPRQRVTYYDGCGAIVEERDPVKRDVVTRYRCGALLGTGGFAQVFDFKDMATGIRYAGKVIDKKTLSRRGSEAKFRMEVDIHSRVRHPNIIQFVKAFQDDYYHYIILEQCSRKSLMELSKEHGVFTCEEMQYIMFQIVSAVEYMHSNLIIHRDLKLGNVMIDSSGNMKVGDFGFASELISPSDRKTTTCGTPNYIAPEVLAAEKTGLGYGLEADIWSLGVILYALAFGTPPFETKDIATTYSKIRRVDYSFPSNTVVPESCKDLIRWMLQKDPQRRPSPSKVLRHGFLCLSQLPRTAPKALVPPETPSSTTSPKERHSPLWASPIAIQSPFAYCEKTPTDYQKGLPRKQEYVKETDHELRMTLHEFLKENDCASETASDVLHSDSNGRFTQPRPPRPSVILQSSIYCNKYGYGFLSFQDGKQYPTVFLNDKTKLVYDVSSDTVFYYGRSRMQATPPDSGIRSPLLSEELAAKGFRDELAVFRNASTSLVHRNEGNDPGSRIEAAAAKKMAITKFFLPFLRRGTKDKRMVAMTCAVKEWHSVWERDLFAPCRTTETRDDIVYVKDAVMDSLYELTGEHQDADIQLLVARMSDYSFQVSVRCNGSPQPLFCPRYSGLEASETNFPWGLDILIYSGFRAVMVLETKQSLFALSFWDIRRDAKTVRDGRVYFAAGTTTQTRSVTMPSALLRVVATLLRKVRCCTDVVDCFC
ncbi:putative protein kinase, putative,polo-like protein kinase [Trypanosoma grayi]|uniref:putative protein kinase, putative,polo-like protein kinase n=1 Tax=Trypanosoma grayi TaxID=71804 RepID=UPI0004F41398|nr:putative protein kinase, putative,polo-like protein kinase [Trypanosoma grayi]KEG14383.1 putative protein kinase, putative,polo-like protein kinase [Trypanosoma grayi]